MKIVFSKKSYLSFKSPVGSKKGSPLDVGIAKDIGKDENARDNEDSFHTAPVSFSERTRLSSSSIFEEPTPKERKVSKTFSSRLSKLFGGKKSSKNCATETYKPLFKDETSKSFDLSAALSVELSDRDVEQSEQSKELKSCEDQSIRSLPMNVMKKSSHLEFKAREDQSIKSLPISATKLEDNLSVGTHPTDDVDEFASDDDVDVDNELAKVHAVNSITESASVTSSPMSDIKPIRYKRLSQAEKQKRTEKMNSIRINRTCGSSLQKAETALPAPFASATNGSRRKSRRNKSDLLDITEHTRIGFVLQSKSLDIPDLPPDQPERKTKKTKSKRTKVPSNGKTKKKTRKTHASAIASRKKGSSKRIDYTGQISESENITKELHRLGSLVELMMSRMDLYEKQSECLVEASLEYNREWSKISQSPKPSGQSPTEKRLMMETSAQDKWIEKLEEIQRGYMGRLVITQSQLKTLRNEQARTDKEIHQELTISDSLRILWNDKVPKNEKTIDPKDSNESMDGKITNVTPATTDDESKTDTNQKVQFDPSVKVATVLSRHDMPPNEKYKYWCGDGDDEEVMTEQMLKILTKKWQQKREEESKQQTEEDLPPSNYTIHIQD